MKNATAYGPKLTRLLKSLPEGAPPDLPDQDDPTAVLIQSFLMWETTTERAKAAYAKIRGSVVDLNELRVSMPPEILAWIGSRYPQGIVRCERLRATLRDVFLREHSVTLEPLKDAGKRDVKKYIESLEGMVPYVSARVMLLCYDTHAVPVDGQLLKKLLDAGVVDESADELVASSWMARQIKANASRSSHFALQAWAEATKASGTSKKKTSKKTSDTADARA